MSWLSHHKMTDADKRKGPNPSAWSQEARATQWRALQEETLGSVQGTGDQRKWLSPLLGPVSSFVRNQVLARKTNAGDWSHRKTKILG